MEKMLVEKTKLIPLLFTSFLLVLALGYSMKLHANQASAIPGTQLAYFIGYHEYNGFYTPSNVYSNPKYKHKRSYWSGWKKSGSGCRKNCLIDRFSGRAIRCSKRC